MAHTFHPSILREYDIRGLIGETLSGDDCYFIGRAFGTMVKRRGGKSIAVGYDGRETSPSFSQRLVAGLTECGLDVEHVGLGPTPMVYFAMKHRGHDAACVVTGSHTPLAYNGVKMAFSTGPAYGDAVREVGSLAAAGDFESASPGRVTAYDVRNEYVDRMLRDFTGPRPLKVAWDAGNGAAGEIMRLLSQKLPGDHILLYDDIDGAFPNHHPDPTVAKNLVDLQKAVRDNGCDVGIGFDGDGDRIGAVDENGNILWADILIALYAREVLAAHPGAPVISDVKSSRVLFDEIARLGGQPVMWNTGHSLIKAKMQEMNAPLAGELAGHICFADKYYGFDDAPYCAVRLLNILSHARKPLSALVAHLPKMHNTPELRFAVPPARKFEIAPEIIARLRRGNEKDISINDIDGARVTTPDGWWLLRPSNTEDVLTARAEGFTPEGLERLKAQLAAQLDMSGVASPF